MKTQNLEIKVSSSDFDMILVTRQEVLWGQGGGRILVQLDFFRRS